MNDRRRRSFMDRPPRVTFVQPVTQYTRLAPAARRGSTIGHSFGWSGAWSCGVGFWSFAAASRGMK